MEIQEILERFANISQVQDLVEVLNEDRSVIQVKGLVGSSDACFATALITHRPGLHVFVLDDKEEAAYFLNDLQALLPGRKDLLFFPETYREPYSTERTDNANVVARAEVLRKINQAQALAVVTYPKAMAEKVVTRSEVEQRTIRIELNQDYDLDELNIRMIDLGFERVDFAYKPGEFAIRGGILDVFAYDQENPVRIEFFGDTVDSIRYFDPVSQISKGKLGHIELLSKVHGTATEEVRQTFFQYAGNRTILWTKDFEAIETALDIQYEKAKEEFDKRADSPVKHLPPAELYTHPAEVREQLQAFSVIEFGSAFALKATKHLRLTMQPQPIFNKKFDLLIQNLSENQKAGIETTVCSGQAAQLERLYRILEDLEEEANFHALNIALREGFIFPKAKMALYTDHQIFERYHRFRLKEGFRNAEQAISLKEIHQLQPGDFVSHIDHGIGRFSGLETMDVHGHPQEAVRLIYGDNDVLYVSIHSLHRIAKYSGKEGTEPKVNKLGSANWKKVKAKTKKKIKELAFDLIKVYAERKSKPGFAYSPDTYLQTELESSFIYEDTPDQVKATLDVKRDMEKPVPMDRLICGDVGFGKTEIAMRAAFKAMTDSKQVAVLVPTTLLSIQHFRNFKERYEDFPVKVALLNRFVSGNKLAETKKGLKDGTIDLVVGTHKLVSKELEFKDLGLLVIDEEQKFGVGVKDKLKTLKATVDTLTMTATPIPRTLQFSLMGARDLSNIKTPPPNRQPVITELMSFNEERIRDAISFEISRGGQVFFVNNRVENIMEVAGMINRLIPGVKVAIGHGQMDGKKLEKVMMDFIEGKYDVLVATSIIESGIDIANANTMIINNAHQFGLSDLHQLRGRVGRSNKKAFCYLISPPLQHLPSDSRKRLEALVAFSDLGSGFNISMRDLDIRGAGDLLGAEQSGFISDLGFEMYKKVLDEAVQELKEKEFKDLFAEEMEAEGTWVQDCVVETDLELRIPEDYVNQVAERLSLYKELDDIENDAGLEKFQEELEDRFGPIPEQTLGLIESMRLRRLARRLGFEKLVLKGHKMIGGFVSNAESPFYQSPSFTKVLQYVGSNPKGVKLAERSGRLRMVVSGVGDVNTAMKRLKELEEFGKAAPSNQQ